MKQTIPLLSRLNETLVVLLKVLLIVVFSILLVDVIWGVGSRYILGDQASWSEELARLMMVWLALLGAALASREDRHLGLDVLVRSWPTGASRIAEAVTHVAVILFALLVMTWGGYHLVDQRFASGQTLPALKISKAWFYLALPVSGLLITLFSVEALIKLAGGSSAGDSETEVPS